jgi:hypothetical protein
VRGRKERDVAPVPPVTPTPASNTTDAADPRLHKTRANGQNEAYLVLSEEERAKGYARPVRRSYVHVGRSPVCGKGNPKSVSDLFCASDPGHDGECGPLWNSGAAHRGCGTLTTMGQAIAETYARDPKFYGATFCCGCGKHLPVGEFKWDGTDEVVGS